MDYTQINNWTNVRAVRIHGQLRTRFTAMLLSNLITQCVFNSCSFNYKSDYTRHNYTFICTTPISILSEHCLTGLYILFPPWCITEAEPPFWEDVEDAMVATKAVVHGLVEFIMHHSHTKKVLEQQVSVGSLEKCLKSLYQ